MPRIAGALAVVATIAFCIGFNVYRYPMVWDMINGPEGVTHAKTAKTSSSEKAAASSESKRPYGADQTKDTSIASKKTKETTPTASIGGASAGQGSLKNPSPNRNSPSARPEGTDSPSGSGAGSKKTAPNGGKTGSSGKTADKHKALDEEVSSDSYAEDSHSDDSSAPPKPKSNESKASGSKKTSLAKDTFHKPGDKKTDVQKSAPRHETARPYDDAQETDQGAPESLSHDDEPSNGYETGFEGDSSFPLRSPKSKKPANVETASKGRLVPVTPADGEGTARSHGVGQISDERRGNAGYRNEAADRTVRRLPSLSPQAMHNPNLTVSTDTVPFYPSTGM